MFWFHVWWICIGKKRKNRGTSVYLSQCTFQYSIERKLYLRLESICRDIHELNARFARSGSPCSVVWSFVLEVPRTYSKLNEDLVCSMLSDIRTWNIWARNNKDNITALKLIIGLLCDGLSEYELYLCFVVTRKTKSRRYRVTLRNCKSCVYLARLNEWKLRKCGKCSLNKTTL